VLQLERGAPVGKQIRPLTARNRLDVGHAGFRRTGQQTQHGVVPSLSPQIFEEKPSGAPLRQGTGPRSDNETYVGRFGEKQGCTVSVSSLVFVRLSHPPTPPKLFSHKVFRDIGQSLREPNRLPGRGIPLDDPLVIVDHVLKFLSENGRHCASDYIDILYVSVRAGWIGDENVEDLAGIAVLRLRQEIQT
jgi:hypothetical protein